MSKGKDDEPTPKARGGRRSKRPMTDVQLKNLKPWKPGQSGNPAGQPKSVLEINRLAREKTPAVIERLFLIALNELPDMDVPPRDQIAAGMALMDRGLGRPAIGIFHGTGPGQPPGFVPEGTEDGTTSLLLRAANAKADSRTLAELKDATRRMEAKLAQESQAKEDHLADAAAALARGEEVPGLTRLLLNARAASAERAADQPPPPKRSAPQIEAKSGVFVADSSGNISAPAPAVESAPPPPDLSEPPPTPPKPPPFRHEPDAPPKAQPKVTHPGASIPGFAEFLSQRDTSAADAERAAKVEEARAGGQNQISAAEAFPPDPRPPMEVINFTRVPGGRGIRRC